MTSDRFEYLFNSRVEKGISKAIELNHEKKRKHGLRDQLKRGKGHVAAGSFGLIQGLLASANFAAEIAFIRERKINVPRRRDAIAATRDKIVTTWVQIPQIGE